MNPLTHSDVEQQTFHASFRGYAEDEVDQFLDEVVASLRMLHQMVADRDQRIVVLARGDGSTDPSQAVSGALIEAQRAADRIVAEARAEALAVAGLSSPTISTEQRAEYEADVARSVAMKGELSTLQATLISIADAAAAAAGVHVESVGETVIEDHDEPEIGLVGFVDPVSLLDEPTAPSNLYEIPAAVQQAEERFGDTRLSDVLKATPGGSVDSDSVDSDSVDSDFVDSDAVDRDSVDKDSVDKDASRRPWERG